MTRRGTSTIISLGAGLALSLATVVIGAGQAAGAPAAVSDASVLANVDVSQTTGTEEEPITFEALEERFDQLYFQGQVSRYAWSFGGIELTIAHRLVISGHCSSYQAVRDSFSRHMAEFTAYVSDPRHVPDESIRIELVNAADELLPLCLGEDDAA